MKSLAHLLPVLDTGAPPRLDFAPAPPPPALQLVASNEFFPEPADFPEPEMMAPAEENDRFQEGYETGYALGLAQGRAQALEESAGQSLAVETFVAKARAEWATEQSQRIADGIAKALRVIEDEIAACVETALRQLADERMRARALEDFSQAVRDLCRFGGAGVVTVHAPHDLAQLLAARFADCPTIEFCDSDTTEVWVRSGATLIEARIGAWAKSLTGAE